MAVSPQEAAATFLQREVAARQKREADGRALRGQVDAWAKAARERGDFERAWLIGSVAWGEVWETSDVDLVVEAMAPGKEGALWADACRVFHRSVDLLELRSLPQAFQTRVLQEGILLP